MSLFEGRALTCVRGERCVFAGLDFAVASGGALVLAGPNGCGKSSLLRLMAGLLKPAAGVITWGGTGIGEDPEAHHARLHYVGHLDAVKPVLTVTENLLFWAGLRGTDGAAARRALARLGLDRLGDVPGRMLSSGQRRRLALARLLAAPTDLWLLDEPTVGLDRQSVESLTAAVAEHRTGGGRVVVATHTPIDLPGGERLEVGDFAGGPALEGVW